VHQASIHKSLIDFLTLLHHFAGKAWIHLAEIFVIFDQMIDIAMQETISPQLTAQYLKIMNLVIGIQSTIIWQRQHFQSLLLVLLHQFFKNFILITEMIIQVTRAHPEFSRNMIGGHRAFATLIEQLQTELQDTLFSF